MAEEDLDALLKRMPDIAKAVNGFTTEAIQQEAFVALLAAYSGGVHRREPPGTPKPSPPAAPIAMEQPKNNGGEGAAVTPKKGRRQSGGGSRDGFKMVRELDLRPPGKPSFVEFADEKQPKSNEDKFPFVIYYLEQVLGIEKITSDHVGTVFRLTPGWREPSALQASLRVTATRKGTIDTSKLDDLRTTPQGRNFVEHDLPAKEKAKK